MPDTKKPSLTVVSLSSKREEIEADRSVIETLKNAIQEIEEGVANGDMMPSEIAIILRGYESEDDDEFYVSIRTNNMPAARGAALCDMGHFQLMREMGF